MAERKRQNHGDEFDVTRKAKKAVNERYASRNWEWPSSRRPEADSSKMGHSYRNAENRRDQSSQDVQNSWKSYPIDLNERFGWNAHDNRRKTSSRNIHQFRMTTSTKENAISNQPVSSPAMPEKVTNSSANSLHQAQDPAENQPKQPSQNSTTASKQISCTENVGDPPVSPSARPGVTSAMKPQSVTENTGEKQSESQSSEKVENLSKGAEADDEISKFIQVVRKFPHVYDRMDPLYRYKERKNESWSTISKILGMNEYDCRMRWKSLREKYSREMKELDSGHVSEQSQQFIDKMKFLPYRKRTGIRRKNALETPCKSSVSARMKGEQSQSEFRSSFGSKASSLPSFFQSDSQSSGREQTPTFADIPKPDRSFAYDIASELQRFTQQQKSKLKAEIWQVIAEFGNSI